MTMTDNLPTHRERLLEHFASFSASEREALAALYGATGPLPQALAERFITQPEVVRAVIAHELPEDSDARRLMEDLAYDHDLFLDVSWTGRGPRRRLFDLGLVARPARGQSTNQLEMVGAIAGVVAPLLPGVATTAVTLLAACDDATIDRVADAWDIHAPSRLERVFRVSQHLAAPQRSDDIVELLGADLLGAALMALELGGICFWQEVFGHDLDQNPEFGNNVVALMRSDERDYERHIADTLLDHAVLFRVESEGRSPLAVVPEELWPTLWEVGRAWMMEWISARVDDLRSSAARRMLTQEVEDFQATIKWFTCEADRETLAMSPAGPSEATTAHLTEVGGRTPEHWATRVRLAAELRALNLASSEWKLTSEPAFRSVLDMPKSSFVRELLLEWCTGYAGFDADAALPRAFGLDDVWRCEAIEFLDGRDEFIPRWMLHEGVDPNSTGSGQIRNPGESTPEQLEIEVALTNGIMWSAKLVWMDLLSMLESHMWYPREALIDVLGLTTGLAVFSQLYRVLEEPNMGYYLPVQRASLLLDDFSVSHFTDWFDAILDGLFVPLGIAVVEEDGVWLDTTALRIETPPGMVDDNRRDVLRAIFDAPDMPFEIVRPHASTLHRVDTAPAGDTIDLDLPLQTVRDLLGDRRIVRFDGRRIFVDDAKY